MAFGCPDFGKRSFQIEDNYFFLGGGCKIICSPSQNIEFSRPQPRDLISVQRKDSTNIFSNYLYFVCCCFSEIYVLNWKTVREDCYITVSEHEPNYRTQRTEEINATNEFFLQLNWINIVKVNSHQFHENKIKIRLLIFSLLIFNNKNVEKSV